jgi:hypothetical protein
MPRAGAVESKGAENMQTPPDRPRHAFISVITVFAFVGLASAANYPLQLISPRGVGTSPESSGRTINSNNRIFRAYPGIEYNIRAAVIGGAYPFTYSLTNAPAGMTINSQTGEISWPNPPDGTSAAPTISVTDAEGTSESASWTITVTTSRFRFLDAVNGRSAANGGTGTRDNPWRTIRDMYEGNDHPSKTADSYANEFLYFLNGTYYLDAYIEDASTNHPGRMPMLGGTKPVVWMAFPGHTPVISYAQGTIPGSFIAFYGSSDNVYVDGLTVVGASPRSYHAFQTSAVGDFQTFRRNNMSFIRSTERSLNQSCLLTGSGQDGPFGAYLVIQDNVCHDVDKGAGIKIYATYKMLIEDNVVHNIRDSSGDGDIEGIALKYGVDHGTVRGNRIFDVSQKAIGGNMNSGNNFSRDIEILYNRIYNASTNAVEINQNSAAGVIHIYRNNFVGRVSVRNTDGADGPFNFYNNVIVNSDSGTPAGSHIFHDNVSAPGRIVLSDNLVGSPSDNIVDGTGNLTSAFSSYLNTHGDRATVSPTPPADNAPPARPQGLRIR